MRWYVALVSEAPEPAAALVVEATSWQGALQSAFELRGEKVAIEQITVELIPDGYRALNTETHAAYELRKAPEDAPLSLRSEGFTPGPFADEDTFAPTSSELVEAEEAAAAEGGFVDDPTTVAKEPFAGALSPPAAAEVAGASKGAENAAKAPLKAVAAKAPEKAIAPKTPEKPTKTGAVKATAAAAKAPGATKGAASASKVKTSEAKAASPAPKAEEGKVPEASPTMPVVAPPLPAARQPAATRTFGSEGQVVADAKLRAVPPALPKNKSAAKPPPLGQAADSSSRLESGPQSEGAQILFARGEDPSAQSPLSYREVALCLPEGTAEAEAERILRQHLQALVEQLSAAPPGKYVALAAFDVRFEGRPPKPPLVTLTWKDWHGPEPRVAYPAQQQALNASMAGMGVSMAGVFPSPFASLPGNIPAPSAQPAPAATQAPYEVLFSRGEDPSARSPLTYREAALRVPEGTSEAEAERLLRQHLAAVMSMLSHTPPGKYVALAAFDVRFEGRPPKPPLVTLAWKDWHGPEPKVAYPLQQRLLHGSMGGSGMSMAGVFPSPFASLPGNTPSPFAAGAPQPQGVPAAPGSAQILFARGEDPSAQSPLSYREVALCLPEGTIEPEAERVLRQHLQALVEQLSAAPPGKYVALAAFDVRFEGRPPKPPLVTLTWKDWHGPEPKVAYPLQQRLLQGSMGGSGMSMAGVFPSPFASLPGNTPSPFNAQLGSTQPMPRHDPSKIPPAAAATPLPPSSRPGAPRSPRDAAGGGGGGGGSGSSDGWPPAAGHAVNITEQSSHDVIASPAVMVARQRPFLQPLPSVADGPDEPTAIVMAPNLPPEAWNDRSDAHSPVTTGEYTIIDEPTPLLGPLNISPEAFRDDTAPSKSASPKSAPESAPPAIKSAPPTPPPAPAPKSAPPPAPAPKSAPPPAPPPKSAPPASAAPKSAPPAASAAPKSAPPAAPAASKPPSAPPAPPKSTAPSAAARPASSKPPPRGGEGAAPKPFNANLTTKMKWVPEPAPGQYRATSAANLLEQLAPLGPGLQALGAEREGVEFLLDLLGRVLSSRLSFCHVYDAGRREFVVAGARAPSGGGRLVGARTPELDPSLEPVLAQKGALVVSDVGGDARYQGGRWALGGEPLRSLLAIRVGGEGQTLGLIELGNPSDGVPFGESDGRAIGYVAEQFAGFLSRLGAPSGGERLRRAMPGGSRLGRSALYFFLPTLVAAVLIIGAYTYRASFQLEQVRQQSVVEATLSLTNEKVDRLDRLVIEQDNVVAAEVDVGGLDEVGSNWLPTAARETPTVRAVLLLDLGSEGREVVAFASRAPGPEDEAFRRLLVRRLLADFELGRAPEGELRHLHKTYNGQSYLLSYWQRSLEGRRHLVVAWHDVPRLVHEVFPRLYADATGRARVSVIDEEGRLIYGTALPSGEFTVGRPFPTTLYGWRLQVALTAADEIVAKAERRRQLEFGLVASACVVIVAGVAFALYAVAKEQRLNRQKIELVANVSHELKTPLALVRMFAEMLHSGRVASDEKRRQYLQIILLESERLGALIENVLDFARLERGAAFDFAPGELGEVVQRAVEVVRYRAENEGMAVTTRLPSGPAEARIDARAIELALINLLDNAIKYAKDGKELEAGIVCHRYAAELYVRDAGPGLPPEEQRKVFERFERGRAAREGRVRGSGIGLALVKHIAEAHGGYAQVRSGPEGGATFVITLPLPDAAPASTGGRPVVPGAPGTPGAEALAIRPERRGLLPPGPSAEAFSYPAQAPRRSLPPGGGRRGLRPPELVTEALPVRAGRRQRVGPKPTWCPRRRAPMPATQELASDRGSPMGGGLAPFLKGGPPCDPGPSMRWLASMANAPGALEEVMGRYAAGDDAAFGRVYDLASGPLFAFLVRLCRDRALAEDLTHETFLRIHRARGLYRPGAAVLPWAYSIGRRLFLDSLRSRRREAHSLDEGWQGGDRERPSDPGVPAPDAGADEEVEARRLAERIERALGEMPETQSTAFRLLKQQGLSVNEAASVLGTTEMTVKLRAHRAYESLRKRLGDVLGRDPAGASTKAES